MANKIPQIGIKLENDKFEIIELTINPIFNSRKNFFKVIPDYNFYVWIELVVGHNFDQDLFLPNFIFSFNNAFYFNNSFSPPINDKICDSIEQISNLYPETPLNNFVLYSHFWFNGIIPGFSSEVENYLDYDLLEDAYGIDSQRVINSSIEIKSHPMERIDKDTNTKNILRDDEIKPYLCFLRPTRNSLRFNYPCSFLTQRVDGKSNIKVTPRPFFIHDFKVDFSQIKINKKESISFWYYLPYITHEKNYMKDIYHDQKGFILNLEINKEIKAKKINLFPRLVSNLKLEFSSPKLVLSPTLIEDPPNWKKTKEYKYPMRLSEFDIYNNNRLKSAKGNLETLSKENFEAPDWMQIHPDKTKIKLFFSLYDKTRLSNRDLKAISIGIGISVLLNIISLFYDSSKTFMVNIKNFYLLFLVIGLIIIGLLIHLFRIFSSKNNDGLLIHLLRIFDPRKNK